LKQQSAFQSSIVSRKFESLCLKSGDCGGGLSGAIILWTMVREPIVDFELRIADLEGNLSIRNAKSTIRN